jgi:hypothetical protein
MGSNGPPVRKEREDGVRTRKAILQQAVSLATVEGLEGLSIGGLAKALGPAMLELARRAVRGRLGVDAEYALADE